MGRRSRCVWCVCPLLFSCCCPPNPSILALLSLLLLLLLLLPSLLVLLLLTFGCRIRSVSSPLKARVSGGGGVDVDGVVDGVGAGGRRVAAV